MGVGGTIDDYERVFPTDSNKASHFVKMRVGEKGVRVRCDRKNCCGVWQIEDPECWTYAIIYYFEIKPESSQAIVKFLLLGRVVCLPTASSSHRIRRGAHGTNVSVQ